MPKSYLREINDLQGRAEQRAGRDRSGPRFLLFVGTGLVACVAIPFAYFLLSSGMGIGWSLWLLLPLMALPFFVPFGLPALFKLMFYPLVLWGLLTLPVAPLDWTERFRYLLDLAIIMVGAWLAVWYFVIGPIAGAGESDRVAMLLSAAYPVGDLVLLGGVVSLVLRRPPPATLAALLMMLTGLSIYIVADLLFGYLSLTDNYISGGWLDIGWVMAYLVFGLAALRQAQPALAPSPESTLVRVSEELAPALTFAAIGYGYGLVLLIMSWQTLDQRLQGLLVGAALLTGFVVTRQWLALRDTARLTEKLRQQSIRDALTGLYNRRYMEESLARELNRMARSGSPLAIIMLDIDHFKRLNDTYGHDTGDQVLRQISAALQAAIRSADIACRYGGEEFVLVMPEAPLAVAQARAEKLRAVVRGLAIHHEGRPVGMITLSGGVAAYPQHGEATDSLLRAADAALYQAKRAGRDQITVAP